MLASISSEMRRRVGKDIVHTVRSDTRKRLRSVKRNDVNGKHGNQFPDLAEEKQNGNVLNVKRSTIIDDNSERPRESQPCREDCVGSRSKNFGTPVPRHGRDSGISQVWNLGLSEKGKKSIRIGITDLYRMWKSVRDDGHSAATVRVQMRV